MEEKNRTSGTRFTAMNLECPPIIIILLAAIQQAFGDGNIVCGLIEPINSCQGKTDELNITEDSILVHFHSPLSLKAFIVWNMFDVCRDTSFFCILAEFSQSGK